MEINPDRWRPAAAALDVLLTSSATKFLKNLLQLAT